MKYTESLSHLLHQGLRAVAIVGLLWMTSTGFVFAQETDSASLQNKLEERKQEVKEIEKEIERINGKQYQTKQQKKEAEQKVERLRGTIENLNGEIENLNDRITSLRSKIQDTKRSIEERKEKIAELEEKINRNKAQVAGLVKDLYTDNTLKNEFYAVASSQNLSEAMNDISYSLTLQDRIKRKLQKIVDHREFLKNEKKQLAREQSQLSERQKRLRRQRIAKETEKQESQQAASAKRQRVSQLQQQEQQLTAREQRLRRKKQEFFNEIRSLKQRIVTRANSPLGEVRWPAPRSTQTAAACTQGYGMTPTARDGTYDGQIHNGIDIGAGIGTPVYAVAEGTVVGRSTKVCANGGWKKCGAGWGNWVAIKHPSGHVSLYSHLSGAPLVAKGESVSKGQQIGRLGNSGYSTGAHLHFSVYNQYSVINEGGFQGAPAYKGSSHTLNVERMFGLNCRG